MPPSVLADRYELGARLGQGGMATVYKALDTRLRRNVAIKVMGGTDVDTEGLVFFQREARAIAALRHENVVQIHDYSGPHETPAYIVMELVEGSSAQEILARTDVPEPVAVAIVNCVAAGLSHAHRHGVVHRDVKPANVMIEPGGRVVLTDFGVAKPFADPSALGQTVASSRTTLVGTPEFMSPEQVMEEQVGPYTDVYAIGSLLYCLLTRASPFAHPDVVEVLRRVGVAEYTDIAELMPDLYPGTVELVRRCLKVEPEARPTADEVAQDCDAILAGLGQRSALECLRRYMDPGRKGSPATASTLIVGPTAVLAETAPIQAPSLEFAGITEPLHVGGAGPRRRPWLVWGLAAVLTLGGAAALFVALRLPTAEPVAVPVTEIEPAPPPATAAGSSAAGSSAAGEQRAAEQRPSERSTAQPGNNANKPSGGGRVKKPKREEPKREEPKPEPARSAPPPAPPPVLEPAVLELKVKPWGAVSVDGQKRGDAPVLRQVSVTPGKHTISVQHPSLGVLTKEVTVKPGERRTLVFEFQF